MADYPVDRIRNPWTPDEDALLQHLVNQNGPRHWSHISKQFSGRSRTSCRLRWCNQLSPLIDRRGFTPEEDEIIIRAHAQFGNKWATIARLLTRRTDNAVKNRWNSALKRRTISAGPSVPGSGLVNPGSSSGSDTSGSTTDPANDPATSLSLSPSGLKKPTAASRGPIAAVPLRMVPPNSNQEINHVNRLNRKTSIPVVKVKPSEGEGSNRSNSLAPLSAEFVSVVEDAIREEVRKYMGGVEQAGGLMCSDFRGGRAVVNQAEMSKTD